MPEKFGNDVRNWLVQLKMTRRLMNPSMNVLTNDEGGDEQVEFQEEEKPEQDLHVAEIMLRRVHANLGHPSKGLMLRLLHDANAPLEMLTAARIFHCPHCDLMARRTGAVRLVQVSRSKELGHTMSIDACHWKRNRDGREAIIVNIIDEASRFHVALVLKEGEPSELGNLTAMDNIEAVRMNGFPFCKGASYHSRGLGRCVQISRVSRVVRRSRH